MPTRGLLNLFGVLVAGCACAGESKAEEELGQRRASIYGGQDSNDSQNAAVLIMRGNLIEYCTGTVIAQRVVLTARHCLFGPLLERNFYAGCEAAPLITNAHAWDPQDLVVYVGHAKPLIPVAHGVEIHSSGVIDICADDVALLEVDADLGIEPLPLRLDDSPRLDEEGTVVGWGWTAEDGPTLPSPRQQRSARILSLGPGHYDRAEVFIGATAFATSEAGCWGDDGAPFISAMTHSVVGIQQGVLNLTSGLADARVRNCIGGVTVFQRLNGHADWIRSSLRSIGTAPWLEGKQSPAPIGGYCEDENECISGLCLSAGVERYCSIACADRACPEGMECVGPSEGRVCSFEVMQAFDGSGGCSLGNVEGRSSVIVLAGFALTLMVLRRISLNRKVSESRVAWRIHPGQRLPPSGCCDANH
jgi:hypothetical protein